MCARPPLFQAEEEAQHKDIEHQRRAALSRDPAVAAWSRLSDVEMHFEDLRPIYLRRASLDHVDVELIIDRFRYVQGYGFKSILKMHFDVGDHLSCRGP